MACLYVRPNCLGGALTSAALTAALPRVGDGGRGEGLDLWHIQPRAQDQADMIEAGPQQITGLAPSQDAPPACRLISSAAGDFTLLLTVSGLGLIRRADESSSAAGASPSTREYVCLS